MPTKTEISGQFSKTPGDCKPLVAVFPFIEKNLGFKIREGLAMEYAIAIIADTQPQLNFLGKGGDRICQDQLGLLIDGIKQAEWKWLNIATISTERARAMVKRDLDWQRGKDR